MSKRIHPLTIGGWYRPYYIASRWEIRLYLLVIEVEGFLS